MDPECQSVVAQAQNAIRCHKFLCTHMACHVVALGSLTFEKLSGFALQ